MASEHGMIEPYESGQVRSDDANRRLISYGTSSYGYDVRCAAEFKIFTNINHAIVDPKDFCLLYTSPSPRDKRQSRMPSSA